MSQWETILDQNSHISPIRIVPHKDHSAEWVDDMFRAYNSADADVMEKTAYASQPPVHTSINSDTTALTKYNRKGSRLYRLAKGLFLSSMILIVAAFSLTKYCDNFSNLDTSSTTANNNAIHYLCQYTHLINADALSKTATATILHKHILGPLVPQLHIGYQWIDSTNLNEASKQIKEYSQTKLREHYIPVMKHFYQTYISDVFKRIVNELKHHLKEYIESGSSHSMSNNEQPTVNEQDLKKDKLRQTAKRLMDFLEEKSRKSAETGLQKEEAREKAREIIQSLIQTESKGAHNSNFEEEDVKVDAEELDVLVAKEIQSILNHASAEKAQLLHQLGNIQAQIKDVSLSSSLKVIVNNAEDDEENLRSQQQKQHYFASALKTEVEGLRAVAENSVRRRTKFALEKIEKLMQKDMDNSIIQQHIKENLQSTQKLALKDLRQTYVQLHETKKQIDKHLLSQQQQ